MTRHFRAIEDAELEDPADLLALFLETAEGGPFDPEERNHEAFHGLAALAKRLAPSGKVLSSSARPAGQ